MVIIFLLVLASFGVGIPPQKAQAAGEWTLSNAGTATLYSVGYGNGKWIAISTGSGIYKSTDDGISWNPQTVGGTLNRVSYTGSQWVISGMNGAIYTSPNGDSWTPRTSGASEGLYGTATDGSTLVTVGDYGRVVYSTDDGNSWTPTTAGGVRLLSVAYGGGRFVAVGNTGTIYYSDSGMSWSPATSGVSVQLTGVTYTNGYYVAVGASGTILVSADGISWMNRGPQGGGTTLYGVTASPSQVVAVGAGGTIISSNDEPGTWTSWTTESSSTTLVFTSIGYGGGAFVGVGQSGMTDSKSLNHNADLSGLTLIGTTLNESFNSTTFSYTADAAATTDTVTVTPTLADPLAQVSAVTVGGTPIAETTGYQVPLQDGSNVIKVVVTAEDGITQQTYTVTVTRISYSSNANLSNLVLSGVALNPSFTSGNPTYTASVDSTVRTVEVIPTVEDSNSTFTVSANGTPVADVSGYLVDLAAGVTSIAVKVTAQDGVTHQTYTVTVSRTASTNALLSNLVLGGVSLDSSFTSADFDYAASVGNAMTSVEVTPTVADSRATVAVAVGGTPVTDASGYQVPLRVGDNAITVVVTAEDGSTQETYTVTVTRAASTNALLTDLGLSGATLNETFASGAFNYTSDVEKNVTSVDLTPMLADSTAAITSVTVNDSPVTYSSGYHLPLAIGDNVIQVLVTAQDGTTKQTYTLTVTRMNSHDATLSDLVLNGVTLNETFNSGTYVYTADVPNGQDATDVTVTLNDSTAMVSSMTVDNVDTTYASATPVPLHVGDNVIKFVITAEDGTTQETYTVTVTRAPSTNAYLSDLQLGGGAVLNETFASGTYIYTANVTNDMSTVDVLPTLADNTATITSVTVEGTNVPDASGYQVPLNVGNNVIKVLVTAEDGTTQHTYQVTVTRDPSSNASLNDLQLSGGALLHETFASDTHTYTADVANDMTSVDVTPVLADNTATITSVTVEGTNVPDASGYHVPLQVGENLIEVLVTAQDGSTQLTYTVTVTRAQSGNALLSDLQLAGATLNETFASGTFAYTSAVEKPVDTVEVIPTLDDSTATVTSITVNGAPVLNEFGYHVPLAFGDNVIDILITAENGNVKTYTVTITRMKSHEASLSGLSLNGVTLDQTFASGTYDYTADVPNSQDATDVTVTLTDRTATVSSMTVDSGDTKYTDATPVSLHVGDNVIKFVITAEDGTTQLTYTVTVTRAASTNAYLSDLQLSGGAVLNKTFASGTFVYTADVPNDMSTVDVLPTLADNTATITSVTVEGTNVPDASGYHVPLSVGNNVLEVLVTAEDGATQQTYTVTVTRAKSSNADLSNLALSGGAVLHETFSNSTYAYTSDVANDVTSLDVIPTLADTNATITSVKVGGVNIAYAGGYTLALQVGDNVVEVLVTAQDGSTQQTYTLTITRAKSSNAFLSDLQLNGADLNEVFASGTFAYTSNVEKIVDTIDVIPTVADNTASYTVSVDGTPVSDAGGYHVPLQIGANVITVVVTAQDGTTQQTYTITVTRAKSHNALLSDMVLNGVTLDQAFASGTFAYTADVANATQETDVTATLDDNTATVSSMKVDGTDVSYTSGVTVPLHVGANVIELVVTAEDGTTQQTYTVTVNRASSSDANLGDLTLSDVTLNEAFSGGTFAYTSDVANAVSSTDVTPTVADSTATVAVSINDTPVTFASGYHVPLQVGANVIKVVVTAQDGTTQQTYTVTVTRAMSSNADLSDLTLSMGILKPVFDAGTTDYTAAVSYAVNDLDVTAVVAESNATLTVNGTLTDSNTAVNVPLQVGSNTITLVVTAQDGTTKTYTVNVSRNYPPPAPPTGDGTGHGNDNGNGHNRNHRVHVTDHSNESKVTDAIGSNLHMTAVVYGADGKKLDLPPIEIDETGAYTIEGDIDPGTYNLVLYVLAPNGNKLAGTMATLNVNDDGSTTVETELIDPFGVARDAVTHQVIAGVDMHLYWADTELNRQQGRTPDTDVELPELPDMSPNQNHNPQSTNGDGEYGWMVFPDGDYYFTAEKDGYETFDSRQDMRDEQQGDTSYIRDGLIHVGDTIVQMNYTMQAKATGEGTHGSYINGYPNNTFQPNKSITRAELAAILDRLYPAAQGSKPPFHDLAQSHWAYDAIANVYAQGIMIGDPNGNFRPEAVVTRAEMAQVIANLKQLPAVEGTSAFTDIADHWAEPVITQAEQSGLLNGYPDGTYRPNRAITRTETVVILNKLLDRNPQPSVQAPLNWTDVSPTFWGYQAILEASVSHAYIEYANGTETWKP
ncbi:MAG TPA: cadherin-like beta sandwich domain-containing protein [Bacilli bacterium]|nr:cadherin-like beta sandwich domain-containing protein [Bacilli bacterium]